MGLNEVAVREKKDIKLFRPSESAMRIHSLETAEKIALRIKDYSALGKAIDEKLEEQALFAADYENRFQHGGNRTEQDASIGVLNNKDYCLQFGFALRTVQRWCEKLLDSEKKETERQIRNVSCN